MKTIFVDEEEEFSMKCVVDPETEVGQAVPPDASKRGLGPDHDVLQLRDESSQRSGTKTKVHGI